MGLSAALNLPRWTKPAARNRRRHLNSHEREQPRPYLKSVGQVESARSSKTARFTLGPLTVATAWPGTFPDPGGAENGLALIAAAKHVIDRARVFKPDAASHASDGAPRGNATSIIFCTYARPDPLKFPPRCSNSSTAALLRDSSSRREPTLAMTPVCDYGASENATAGPASLTSIIF